MNKIAKTLGIGAEDEGDGDLGLQGMTLDDTSSPPQQSVAKMQSISSTETKPAKKPYNPRISISSVQSTASIYHSADEETPNQIDKNGFNFPETIKASPQSLPESPETPRMKQNSRSENTESFANSTSPLSTPQSTPKLNGSNSDPVTPTKKDKGKAKARRSSGSLSKSKDKEERKLQKKLSKLHNEIAGPVAERPMAGSAQGPLIAPRRASVVISKRLSRESSSRSNSKRASISSSVGNAFSPNKDTSPLPSPTEKQTGTSSITRPSHISRNSSGSNGNTRTGLGIASSDAKIRSGSHPPATNIGSAPSTSSRLGATSAPPLKNRFSDGSSHSTLDEFAVQRWVLSVGCVNFDLEKGPDLEFLYPSLGISREERDNIAFSSFPDTSIFDDGHAVFSWRVREVPLDSSNSEAPIIGTPLSSKAIDDNRHSQKEHSSNHQASTSTASTDIPTHSTLLHKSSPGSGARRLFGRGLIRRSNSGDHANESTSHDHEQSTSAYEPLTTSPTLPELPEGVSNHLPVPKRQDSTASTPSNASVDHQAALEHAQNIMRVASPAAPNAEQGGTIVSPTNGQKRSASTSSNYIHGYCFFRQKRDATIRRGYFQKSVVILSHLPYVSFFSELVRRLGPLFFETGMPILEAFCHDVQNWEPPEPGAKLHLPFLGSVISVELPYYSFSQSTPLPEAQRALTQRVLSPTGGPKVSIADRRMLRKTDGSREDAPILASIPSTSLFEVFQELIGDLWLMWECLLLAEPMLVVAPDPTACSEAVWHMLDLIKPIPYAGDFRPFFTIHDFDFRTLVTKNKPAAGTIIGVTNPFMLQACKHWPHVLKVGRSALPKASSQNKKPTESTLTPSQSSTNFLSSSFQGGTTKSTGAVAGGNSAGGGGPEHTPGLISKRKRRISKDRALIKQLVEAAEGRGCSAEVANELLRKYFTDLTERFLAPLNRYVSSLIPAEFDLSSPYETPKIRPFNTTAFLSSLKTHGTPLQLKSKNLPTGPAVRQSLYVDFLQCPNFSLWLHMRIRQSQEEQYMRKLRALESGNVASFANARGEMESVELYARLQVEIKGINDRLLAGRKERELEPNSRWKCSPKLTGSSDEEVKKTSTAALAIEPSDDIANHNLGHSVPGSSPQISSSSIFRGSQAIEPLSKLANLPSTSASAAWIRQTIGEPGWQKSFTHGERTLLTHKAGLIDQVQRLLSTLPEDLRQSLRLKEQQRQQQEGVRF